jgi:hypothetical protein
MDKVVDTIKDSSKDDLNFLTYVFNFDDENKANMTNMMQYVLLGVVPVVVILKLIKHYVPEDDDSKGSIEILAEVVAQLAVIFLAIWFVDKMIRFIPTYSGLCYHAFNETNFILPILIILVTMQTKLGSKINLLVDRVSELWGGGDDRAPPAKNSNVRVSQPLSGGHQPSQSDYLDNTLIRPPAQMNQMANTTMISDLPQMNQQQYTDVNQMADPSPLMAANEALGGAFGSAF